MRRYMTHDDSPTKPDVSSLSASQLATAQTPHIRSACQMISDPVAFCVAYLLLPLQVGACEWIGKLSRSHRRGRFYLRLVVSIWSHARTSTQLDINKREEFTLDASKLTLHKIGVDATDKNTYIQ